MQADLIVPRLYLGNLVSGRSLHWLQRRNISHVLAIGCGYDRHGQHIKYMNLSVGDTRYDNLLEHFDDTFAFIEQGRWQGTGVLVHCLAGQSRSATVVAAYLMAKGGMHHHRALHMIRLRRPSIRPRSSFICQLQLYKSMGFSLERGSPEYRYFLRRHASMCRRRLE